MLRCSGRFFSEKSTLCSFLQNTRPSAAPRPPCCAPTHLRCAGVPPGLLAPPNAPASAASRPPVGGGSFAPPLLRTDPPSVRRCFAGLIGSAKRSGFSRSAASGGRGELRSPLRPPLLPPAFCRFVVQKGKSVSDRQTDRQHTADYFGANSQYAKKGEP